MCRGVKVTAESIPPNLRIENILQRSGSSFTIVDINSNPIGAPSGQPEGSRSPTETAAPVGLGTPIGSNQPPPSAELVSAAVSLRAHHFLNLLLPSLLAVLAIIFRLPLHSVIVIVAFSAIVYLPTSLAPIASEIDLELRVPIGYQFNDVKINILSGTLTTTSEFSVQSASINLCGNSINTVSLSGLSVRRTLNVCAGGQITVTSLRMTSALVSNFTSEAGAVSVSYAGSFVGRWSAQTRSGNITVTGGDCINQEQSGSCRVSLYPDSTTLVQSALGVTLDLGAAAPACSASWISDPEYEFVAPRSPELSPSPPLLSTTYNIASNWSFLGSFSPASPDTETPPNGFRVTLTAFFGTPLYLYPRFFVNFRAGFEYTFSFRARIFNSGGDSRNISFASIQIFAADNPTWDQMFKISDADFANNISTTIFSSGENVTSFSAPVSATLISAVDRQFVRLMAQIKLSEPLLSSVQTLEFLDIQLITRPTPWVDPVLVSGESEKATIAKMPVDIDPNPRAASDCPHLKPGLRHWHDPSIWPGNTVPAPSSSITLPANMSVLISSCSLEEGDYNFIHVPETSELIFADAPINLRVRNILVEGKLFMGSPSCRLHAPINVTLIGNMVTTDEIGFGLGVKGIGVTSIGSIDVHGYQFHPTWTRLAASINVGDNRIYLQDSVNWAIGQQVVVATSIMEDYENDQNEVVTIVAIRDGGKVLEVEPFFKFFHYGGSEYQAEVGLLSRRISFQGDSLSDSDKFGGHVTVHGQGRLSGVQFYKMGQQNKLGRHPIGFNMASSSSLSYAHDNSFWNGFYRCVSINQTHGASILRNVGWNTDGSCFFLASGREENNTISFNLAMHIRCIGSLAANSIIYSNQDAVVPADRAAAGFFITNAFNTLVGNAASGGWAGFSFPFLPSALSGGPNIFQPGRRTTKQFDGNTAHSSGYHFRVVGGCIFVAGSLSVASESVLLYEIDMFARETVEDSSSFTPAWMRFSNVKTWLCLTGLSHGGRRAEILNAESHDSLRAYNLVGDSWISTSLINARSQSPLDFVPAFFPVQGLNFRQSNDKTILIDVEFRNFQPRTQIGGTSDGAIASLSSSNYFKPQGISATARISFTNVDRALRIRHYLFTTEAARYFNFGDWDGSFVGADGPRIVGSAHQGDWWRFDPDCVKETAWNVFVCPKSGTREVGNLNVIVPINVTNPITGSGLVPLIDRSFDNRIEYPSDPIYQIGNVSLFGPGISPGRTTPLTRNPGITGVTNLGWSFWFSTGTPRTMKVYTNQIPRNGFIIFAVRYPLYCALDVWVAYDFYTGPTRRSETTAASSFSELLNGDGLKTYRSDEFLFVKMVVLAPFPGEPNPSETGFEREGIKVYDSYSVQAYNINATCGASTADFLPVSYLEPLGFWN